MATKLKTNVVVKTSPINTVDIHTYSAKVQNDYDYTTFTISANNTTDAQQNAVDEYFRQIGLLPNSVNLTLIK